jgi:hypothetical protein
LRRAAAIKRVSVLALIIVLVAAGGLGLYYFTSPPNAANGGGTTAGSNGIKVLTNQGSAGTIVVQYNGSSYQAAAKGPNSPAFASGPILACAIC